MPEIVFYPCGDSIKACIVLESEGDFSRVVFVGEEKVIKTSCLFQTEEEAERSEIE